MDNQEIRTDWSVERWSQQESTDDARNPTLADLDALMLKYTLSIEVIPASERGYDKSAAFMAMHIGTQGMFAPSTHRTVWQAAVHQAGKVQFDIDFCERVERERRLKGEGT